MTVQEKKPLLNESNYFPLTIELIGIIGWSFRVLRPYLACKQPLFFVSHTSDGAAKASGEVARGLGRRGRDVLPSLSQSPWRSAALVRDSLRELTWRLGHILLEGLRKHQKMKAKLSGLWWRLLYNSRKFERDATNTQSYQNKILFHAFHVLPSSVFFIYI